MEVPVDNHWQEMAVLAIVEDLVACQTALANAVLADGADGLEAWAAGHKAKVAHARDLLSDMRHAGNVDIAMLTVASRELKNMVSG